MALGRPRIIMSQHGTLIKDLFFSIYIDDEDAIRASFAATKMGFCLKSERRPPERSNVGTMPRYCKAQVSAAILRSRERCPNLCSQGAEHTEGFWGSGGNLFDEVSGELNGGKEIGKTFIASDGEMIVNASFGKTLRNSRLSGFELLPFSIAINQSYFAGTPHFEYLQITGKNCLRRWRVELDQNLCPLCRQAPVYCPECGWMPVLCGKCSKPVFKEFEFVHEGPALPGDEKRTSHIVEARNSDGADFFRFGMGQTIVSRRALVYLLNAGAAPFVVNSLWTCIDGVTNDRKAEIDRVLKMPVPTEGYEVRGVDRPK